MNPEQWKRIEELYHAARARAPGERAAFLAAACPDDEALRRDVASLLEEPSSADGFLAEPAFLLPGRLETDSAPGAMAGRSLAGYQLQTLLGAGGMGEVYRARDQKLARDVAIKILPRAFTSDADRLARFEREARMLAALNHPNICAIYGLEEADGIRFLILELVEGVTLAETLRAKAEPGGHEQGDSYLVASAFGRKQPEGAGLPLRDALTIARQIVHALEIAHEKGIIHRDLKPANITITPDGVVKILDFGLAKAVGGDGSSPDLTHEALKTSAGIVMGTAAYMSPEQARGKSVDKRTDIWAFGCILYEMVSGRAPFAGETVSDTIGKILEREPDWSVLPAATPAPIRRLLLRCLAKDPKQRLRDIGDVRIEIDEIDEVLPGTPGLAVLPAVPAKRIRTWLPWIALATLALGVGLWAARRPPTLPENPLASAQFSRFTDWEGTEAGAEISPDGRFVAFLADKDGEVDLWVSQVGTDRFVNLTRDFPPLDDFGVLRTFGFSGDGTEIWFSPEPKAQKLLMPMTGGTPRPFLGTAAAAASWSSDGRRLVYFTGTGSVTDVQQCCDPLFVADRTGADAHQIIAPRDGWHNHNPVWSLDDQWIYFVRGFVYGLNQTDEMDVWRIRPSGESLERLTRRNTALSFLAPLDQQTLLYVGRAENWSGPWLWALDVPSKVSHRVSVGLEQYTTVAASRDGRHVVATVASPIATLWRVPLRDVPADDRDAQPYQVPTARALAPRFGRTSLFYLSGRGTGDGLWRFQNGTVSEIWKGSDGALFEPAAVSPDGSRVAVVLRRDGKQRLAIMSADGTGSRALAPTVDIQGTADWSPDGNWIVTGGRDAQGPALFKIPLAGGAPVRLVAGQAMNPIWSPDGKLIVYTGSVVAGQVPLLGVRPDAAPAEVPQVLVRPGAYRFLPDGTGLVYLPRKQSLNFWQLDLATKATRQLTRLSNHGRLETFDITPDGKHIVFDRSRDNSNIVLIDLPNR